MNQKYLDALHLNVYQIYPKSFCDANGDGIGDIPGIIEKLDYLRELGINAIWLCPCYKSPQDDGGYDVSDFRDIAPEYGTLEDLKKLIKELHKRGMKLIMDFVPNHTSSAHRWFQESRKGKDNPYADYYYWFDEIPNDWQSIFGGSAYQYDESRKQYYLHSYAVSQPDLNWDNPAVRKEMAAVVDYWSDFGVDGFRCDVIDQISKDWEGNRNCFGPHLHDYIHEIFGRERACKLFTVGECWATDIEEIQRHCAYHRGELTTLFQFDHLEVGRDTKWVRTEPDLRKYRDILIKWQNLSQYYELVPTIFTDNHDQPFLVSRLGEESKHYESCCLLAAMTYLLRGVPFLYQSIEYGATSSHFSSIKDFRDIESLNYYNEQKDVIGEEEALERVNFGSRDNARHPFSWNDKKNAGFGNGEPWMQPSSNYQEINLVKDLASERSVFRFYQSILKLRNEHKAFTEGYFTNCTWDDRLFAFLREDESERYLVVCSLGDRVPVQIDAVESIALSSLGREELPSELEPYEVLVVKLLR